MSTPSVTAPTLGNWVRRAVFGTVLILLLLVGGTALRVWQVARADDRTHADVIVVLGASQRGGKPGELLEARLQHAKQLYDEGVAKTVVTSGGKAQGDAYTEAEAGALWLRKEGVPVSATLPVEEGRDTLGTLRAVSAAVHQRGWNTAVIVSDPWHSLRARTMAMDSGLDAWSSPTHRGPSVQTRDIQAKYIFRETGALLFYRLSKDSVDEIAGNG